MSRAVRNAPTKADAVARKTRNKKIFELRMAGASEASIADVVGLSAPRVHRILHEIIDNMNKTMEVRARHLLRMELERLDAMMLALWANKNDPRAGDTLLRIMERRAKYMGLDSPTKIDQTNRQDGPIEHKHDITKLSTADLDELERILGKAEGDDVDDTAK